MYSFERSYAISARAMLFMSIAVYLVIIWDIVILSEFHSLCSGVEIWADLIFVQIVTFFYAWALLLLSDKILN